MWLPKWFYDLLPYLYAVVGVGAASLLRTAVGYMAGLVFLTTACLLWIMRRDYRQRKVDSRKEASD
jgi:nitrate reductase gamma subunit